MRNSSSFQVSGRFHVSIDRVRDSPFEVAICDLKGGARGAALPTLCLYRTRCSNAFECIKQRERNYPDYGAAYPSRTHLRRKGRPMTEKLLRYDSPRIEPIILTVRGRKVVLDMELARIYGVTTKVFNQAVKRNRRKFPPDFMFRLTAEEYEDLTSQFAISNRSQIVTGSQKHRNPR